MVTIVGLLFLVNGKMRRRANVVSLVILALAVLNVKTYRAFRDLKPLVIRISDVGRAEAVHLDSFSYQPQEAEIRYFLIDFVQLHYSRMRVTGPLVVSSA